MPLLTGKDGVAVPVTFLSDATQRLPLGFKGRDNIGREYAYVKAGASDLVVGNAIQSPAQTANHAQCAVAVAAAIGASSVIITPVTTAITAQEYVDGLAVVDTTPGIGYAYRVNSHAAWTTGNFTVNLAPEDGVVVALTTSSKITLVRNPYSGVIQCPITTPTGQCVGGCVFIITAAQFGWVQTHGPGAALITGTPAVGQQVSSQAAAAGALGIISGTKPLVAEMMVTGIDAAVLPVFWLL